MRAGIICRSSVQIIASIANARVMEPALRLAVAERVLPQASGEVATLFRRLGCREVASIHPGARTGALK